jgi:hypothetical protein
MKLENSEKDLGPIDHLLTTDDFRRPMVLKGNNAIGVLLVRLLLMTPGTNPLYPTMGVGLGTRYRFISADDIDVIRAEIERQMDLYLPIAATSKTSVILKIGNAKYLSVVIFIDDQSYLYNTEDSPLPVEFSD